MVTDINDKNPEFVGLPYEFSVKEGEARKLIGRVHAEDADEGINAEITYFAPDDIPFTVDPDTGDVLTKIVLDYEQNNVSNCCYVLQSSISKAKHWELRLQTFIGRARQDQSERLIFKNNISQ